MPSFMLVTDAAGRKIGFNFDKIVEFQYTPAYTIDDPESELGKVGDKIESVLRLEYAVPDYTHNGYADGSSKGGTTLHFHTMRGELADEVFEALERKSETPPARTKAYPALFEIEGGEATGRVLHFCSEACRQQYLDDCEPDSNEIFRLGMSSGYCTDSVCDWCSTDL